MFRPKVLTARPSIFSWSTRTFSSADWRDLLFLAIFLSDRGFGAAGALGSIKVFTAPLCRGKLPRGGELRREVRKTRKSTGYLGPGHTSQIRSGFRPPAWMQVDWGSYPNAFPRREPTENSLSALALRSAKSNTCCDKIFNCVSTRGQMQLPAASNT